MEITELTLLSNDLENTEQFYVEKLGLEKIERSENYITFRTLKTKFTFKKSEVRNPVYHFAFNIPCNKLEEAMNLLSTKIPILEIAPAEKIADYKNWNAKSFYFYDNNGNILEYIARFDLQEKSLKSFGGSSVISISEIGLVVDDVIDEAEIISQKYNLPYFTKQKPTENFAALGDDEGLLLLIERNKLWIPTDVSANTFPLSVTFIQSNNEHILNFPI